MTTDLEWVLDTVDLLDHKPRLKARQRRLDKQARLVVADSDAVQKIGVHFEHKVSARCLRCRGARIGPVPARHRRIAAQDNQPTQCAKTKMHLRKQSPNLNTVCNRKI